MHAIQEFISKIRIIFNEKFINFINKLKKEIDLSMLLNSNISYILPTQQEIRKYIYINSKMIDLTSGKINYRSHPDIFAIMISILVPNIEKFNSFQKILDLSFEDRLELGLFSTDNVEGLEGPFKCACNHECCPSNLIILFNKDTGLHMAIGCDCASKTKLEEKIKELKKEIKQNKTYNTVKKNNEIRKIKEKMFKNNSETESWDNIKQNFAYNGGNFDIHKTFLDDNNDDNLRPNFDICYCCNYKSKQELYLLKNNENNKLITVCKQCCSLLEKNIVPELCKYCRKVVEKCDIYNHCLNECAKFIYCNNCHINKVDKIGNNCRACKPKCEKCKKILTGPYRFCFDCKNKCYICNKYVNPPFMKCFDCNQKSKNI
jgi:hypothetical protein